ncbi:hypothetical protein BH10PSE2_BH10PSE2_17350 [soil metagenome]
MSDILAVARLANAAAGITGALTVVDGRFVQVIEGATGSLNALVARLERDRRHIRLEILDRRGIAERAFADWDMISPRLAASEVRRIGALLTSERSRLDDYIPILHAAIARQEAVIESGVREDGSSKTAGIASANGGADL